MNHRRTDTLPWYKQFWPWVLIGLPATAVVASLYTVVIANQHADDLVVDDYYKEGLAINQQLDRIREAETLNLKVSINGNGRTLTLTLEGDINPDMLRVHLSHPIDADRDINLALLKTGEQTYVTQLPEPLSGRWHWTVDAGDGSDWRIDGDQTF